MSSILKFLRGEEGPTSVEYAVMLALIITSCVVTIKTVGSSTSGIWASNQQKLDEAGFSQSP